MKSFEISEVFDDYMFVQPGGGHYPAPDGWYPLLGLPGVIDIQHHAVLFCKLRRPVETQVQRLCLNGVIDKIRIHRSARVNAPDTMLVLASDLLREFEVCKVPLMPDAEVQGFIDEVHSRTGDRVNT
ncbi:MAG: hypothetical protein NT123_07505 [Proteobacteria bacterium]|nr:hypothetical protein [Pseudomonadota bacterium]